MKSWFTGALLTIATLAPAAYGSTVTLTGPSTVAQNSNFVLTLVLNATDVDPTGTHPGQYAGSVTIDFDPAKLVLLAPPDAFKITSPEILQSGPTTGSAAGHTTLTVGFSTAIPGGISGRTDVIEIGKFSFKAIGAAGSSAVVALNDGDTFFGSFIKLLPNNQPFYPIFTGKTVQITAVPVPASAWLFGAALGLLGMQRRRA